MSAERGRRPRNLPEKPIERITSPNTQERKTRLLADTDAANAARYLTKYDAEMKKAEDSNPDMTTIFDKLAEATTLEEVQEVNKEMQESYAAAERHVKNSRDARTAFSEALMRAGDMEVRSNQLGRVAKGNQEGDPPVAARYLLKKKKRPPESSE